MRTLRPIFCIAIAVVFSLVVADSAKAIKVLMHGREVGATFRDDPFILTHLQDKYGAANVTYMQGSAAAADGSSATGFDVVFISSTMASGDTRNKYEDSPVGIVCDENALAHDNNIGNFFLSDAGGNQDATAQTMGRNKINILQPSHPLAAGLSGEVTVFNTTPTDTYWWQFARGGLAPGVDRIAESLLDLGTAGVSGDYNNNLAADGADYVMYRKNLGGATALPNDNQLGTPIGSLHYDLWRARFGNTSAANDGQQHAILAAEVGKAIYGNGTTGSPATAAGRRVFFFMSDFGFFDLSADGVKLFDAAIDWAAADPPAGGGSSAAVPEPGCGTLALIALLSGMGRSRRSSRM
jgi:hypothetical protein